MDGRTRLRIDAAEAMADCGSPAAAARFVSARAIRGTAAINVGYRIDSKLRPVVVCNCSDLTTCLQAKISSGPHARQSVVVWFTAPGPLPQNTRCARNQTRYRLIDIQKN